MILTTFLKIMVIPVFPTKEHRHLKSGHLQIILPSPVREHQISTRQELSRGDELVGESDGAVGHVVVPLQLPATVLRLVELLHLRVEEDISWTKCSNVSLSMIAGLTSGIKSSSSLGKVTGTLSLVLAQAPTLRIFIDTCNEDFRHHTSTTEETLQLAIWQPQLLFHSLSKAAHRVPCFRVPVLLLVFELVVQVFADFDVLEHSR